MYVRNQVDQVTVHASVHAHPLFSTRCLISDVFANMSCVFYSYTMHDALYNWHNDTNY